MLDFFSLLELYKGTFSIGLLKSQMFAIVLGVGYATESLTPVCTPMWFFYALFIIKIVYAVVPKTKISKTFQFVLCLVAVRLLTIYNIDTYIPLDSAIMAYPFFLIAHVAETTRKSRLLSLFLYYPISFLCLMVGAILIRCVMVLIIAYLYLPVSLPRFLY